MRRLTPTLLALLVGTGLLLASPAAAAPPTVSHFSRMFDLPGFTGSTNQELADLAQTMLDPNADAENNPDPEMTSVYTYFGQFIDHDLTFDAAPSPTAPVDPTTLVNGRTFRFDLDSVYGGGPSAHPELYQPDGAHFLIQEPNPNGVIDLPRTPDGRAILVEPRNDENEIISQIHVAFLRLHNRLVDTGLSFAQAQALTIHLYQQIVLSEVLPHFVGDDLTDATVNNEVKRFYKPGNPNRPDTPVEFSVAAYRFGHSMVRRAYELTNTTGKVQVFSATAPDLRGARQLPAGRQIDWGLFVSELTRPENKTPVSHVNQSRKMDGLISSSLFVLPIPGAEAEGSNVLAFRNLVRAKFYDMGSGQDLAKAMGVAPIAPAQFTDLPAFQQGTPAWSYILGEASKTAGGKTLGPVGGRIVADVFVKLLEVDKSSILHGRSKKDDQVRGANDAVDTLGAGPRTEPDEPFQLDDLFVSAGLAKRA
jgi:hypothetical protein